MEQAKVKVGVDIESTPREPESLATEVRPLKDLELAVVGGGDMTPQW